MTGITAPTLLAVRFAVPVSPAPHGHDITLVTKPADVMHTLVPVRLTF